MKTTHRVCVLGEATKRVLERTTKTKLPRKEKSSHDVRANKKPGKQPNCFYLMKTTPCVCVLGETKRALEKNTKTKLPRKEKSSHDVRANKKPGKT